MKRNSRRAPVTPAEFDVLCALWDLGAGTVSAVHSAMPRGAKLSYNTVLTQVRLLYEKGYLDRESLGRAHVYRPRLDRDQTLRRVVRQFVKDYFGGEPAALARQLRLDGAD